MDLMDLVAQRVKIVCGGSWQKESVVVFENKKYSPETNAQMFEVAQERFTTRKAKNPKLFDGNAFHLNLACSVIHSSLLFLAVGPMKYSLYDIARQEYADKYGWQNLPTGMGVNVAVITADEKIVMHDRLPEIDHALKISVIGGVYNGGHPFDYVKKEIMEEIGLQDNEMANIRLIGISNRLDERVNHELTFLAKIPITSEQVNERERSVKEKEGKLFFIEAQPTVLKEYLKTNHSIMLSTGFSCLVLCGRHLWGDAWSQIE